MHHCSAMQQRAPRLRHGLKVLSIIALPAVPVTSNNALDHQIMGLDRCGPIDLAQRGFEMLLPSAQHLHKVTEHLHLLKHLWIDHRLTCFFDRTILHMNLQF